MKYKNTRMDELVKVLNQNLVKDSVVGSETVGGLRIESRAVNLTPKLAAFLLNRNIKNRPLQMTVVKRYAKDLSDKNWVYDSNPIQFDYNGNLTNGQHRLHSIVESGVTEVFKIVTGVKPESFMTADQLNIRKGADAVAIAGYENARHLASTAYFVYNTKKGVLGARATSFLRQTIRNSELLTFIELSPALIESVNFFIEMKKGKQIPMAILHKDVVSGFHFIFGEKDMNMAKEFLIKLLRGEDLKADSPIYHLRNKLVNHKVKASRADILANNEILKLVVLAWNKFRNGEKVKRLDIPKEMPPVL